MSELKPSTMTDDERLKLITWLESRAQGSAMPGASRMYKLALDAIRAQPTNEPMPTIDAVEVVRCRDCVHFGECLVTGNDYCSKGERKETD